MIRSSLSMLQSIILGRGYNIDSVWMISVACQSQVNLADIVSSMSIIRGFIISDRKWMNGWI